MAYEPELRGAKASTVWGASGNLNPSVIAVSSAAGSTPCNITTNGDSHNPSWAPVGFQPK